MSRLKMIKIFLVNIKLLHNNLSNRYSFCKKKTNTSELIKIKRSL